MANNKKLEMTKTYFYKMSNSVERDNTGRQEVKHYKARMEFQDYINKIMEDVPELTLPDGAERTPYKYDLYSQTSLYGIITKIYPGVYYNGTTVAKVVIESPEGEVIFDDFINRIINVEFIYEFLMLFFEEFDMEQKFNEIESKYASKY